MRQKSETWQDALARIPSIEVPRVTAIETGVRWKFLLPERRTVRYPDGSEHGWEVITRPKRVVAVLANTADRALVLIAGHRPLIGRWNVTLPAGLVEPGKTPEEACRDELHEETGYVGETVRYLATPPSSPGLTDEATMLHHMPDVVAHPDGQRLEATEQIEVLRVPLHEFETFMLAVLAREDTFALDAKIAFALRIAQLKNLL